MIWKVGDTRFECDDWSKFSYIINIDKDYEYYTYPFWVRFPNNFSMPINYTLNYNLYTDIFRELGE